ncbi:MAG: hypothetical protein U0996_24990 [Planctomycetaceae bacterium]
MSKEIEIINSRIASIRAESANDAKASIDCVMSTEAPVLMFDRSRWEVIDEILLASGRTLAPHIPLLDSHDRSSVSKVLGHFEGVVTEEATNHTLGTMLFDQEDEEAMKVFRKYRGGHVKDISVGYQVTSSVMVEAGETIELGGRMFTANAARRLRIALKWQLNEGSAVPIGADPGAKARSACVQVTLDEAQRLIAERSQKLAGAVPAVECGSPAGTGGKNERRGNAMSGATTDPAPVQAVDNEALIRQGVERESKRRAAIQDIAEGVSPDVVRAAVDDVNCDVDSARAKFLADLQKQRKQSPTPSNDAPQITVAGNRSERDRTTMALAFEVARQLGVNPENVAHRMVYDEYTRTMKFHKPGTKVRESIQKEVENNLERSDAYRGISSSDLCREALKINQVEAPIGRVDMITRAFSIPSVSTIYTQAMGAVLLSALGDMNDSTQGWTKDVPVKNFKRQELHRLEGGRLRRRDRGTEAKHATFADTMETYRIYDYAETLVLDRQDLIDDEIGAWKTALDAYALAIRSLRPDLVYALLLTNSALSDGIALFHASHGNLLGTGYGLSMSSLQSGLNALGSQKGSAGLNLNLRDAYLVTGITNGFTADQLASSAEIREAAAANGVANPILKRNLGTQSDSRIDTGFVDPVTEANVAAVPTTWFIAAKGGDYGICVGTLEGNNGMPTISSTVLQGGGKYGISLDVQFPIGAGVSSYAGLVLGRP